VNSHERRKCSQQGRTSTSFVDNTIDLSRRNFVNPEFWDKSTERTGKVHNSWRYPNFPTTQLRIGERKPPCESVLGNNSEVRVKDSGSSESFLQSITITTVSQKIAPYTFL